MFKHCRQILVASLLVGCGGDSLDAGQVAAELTQEQCSYFSVNDRVTLCHHTGSARKPYTVIRTNIASCGGHAGHDGDYIAVGDPTCNGQGCFPEGAPYDGSVECCEGLAPENGYCRPASTCDDQQVACTGDLSNIGTGDFRISFTVSTTQAEWTALTSQRSACNHASYEDWWQVRMEPTGVLLVEAGDEEGNFRYLESVRTINDGQPHEVVIARRNGILTVDVDCDPSPPSIEAGAIWGPLPSLLTTVDVCEAAGGSNPLQGTLTDLCIGG